MCQESLSEEAEGRKKAKPRTEPIDLEEQLTLEEAKGAQGNPIVPNIKDPNYPQTDWQKKVIAIIILTDLKPKSIIGKE